MATIVPKLDRLQTPTGAVPTTDYTVSIIVMHRRPVTLLDPVSNNLLPENQVGEQVVRVRTFYSGAPAFSGGDVTLVTRGNRAEDLELASGDWVMFSGIKTTAAPGPGMPVHKWYRVINPGEEPVPDSNNNVWTRDVTVVGPDWDSASMPQPQVTIVRGVVEVLEKTISLETSSMWME
jgi:hypothetical protein